MWFLALIGPVFGAIKSYLEHRTVKVTAQRDQELASIQAGVEIQKGSWKDEYFTIFWTAPLYPPLFASVWYWDPYIFVDFVSALPNWYTVILIGMTTASFGVKTFKDWKAGVLEREIKWDRQVKNGHNGRPNEIVPTPDPYAAVRPDPLPKSDG